MSLPFDLNVKILAGAPLAVAGALLTLFGSWLVNSGLQDRATHIAVPRISFQKVAYFWVDVGNGVHQIGALIQLANISSNPGIIKAVTLVPQGAMPIGNYHLRKILIPDLSPVQVSGNSFVGSGSNSWFKLLTPVKFDLTFSGGPEHPAKVLFHGRWYISFGRGEQIIEPQLIGTFHRVVTIEEWLDLLSPKTKIDPDTIRMELPAPSVDTTQPINEFVLFNMDQSAIFDSPGFDSTPAARNQRGTVVFVRGWGTPKLKGGWEILGKSYEETWNNPVSLSKYNSVVQPDPITGSPKEIGRFL